MHGETDRAKLQAFMKQLAQHVRGRGRIYFTGGGTALLYDWRATTIDIDLKADPEPPRFFEAIATLKETLNINIEFAAPDDFIPEVPGWRERSILIAEQGEIAFYHYDLYSQALSKLERAHGRDLEDVEAMLTRSLIDRERLWELFCAIEPQLVRYPAIDRVTLRAAVFEVREAASDD